MVLPEARPRLKEAALTWRDKAQGKELARLESQADQPAAAANKSGGAIGAEDRFAIVEEFLSRVQREAYPKANKTHVWKLAGHTTGRQFYYWQAGDPKATVQDDQNFRRILALSPAKFKGDLIAKRIIDGDSEDERIKADSRG
jgi:hypothetical protein